MTRTSYDTYSVFRLILHIQPMSSIPDQLVFGSLKLRRTKSQTQTQSPCCIGYMQTRHSTGNQRCVQDTVMGRGSVTFTNMVDQEEQVLEEEDQTVSTSDCDESAPLLSTVEQDSQSDSHAVQTVPVTATNKLSLAVTTAGGGQGAAWPSGTDCMTAGAKHVYPSGQAKVYQSCRTIPCHTISGQCSADCTWWSHCGQTCQQ